MTRHNKAVQEITDEENLMSLDKLVDDPNDIPTYESDSCVASKREPEDDQCHLAWKKAKLDINTTNQQNEQQHTLVQLPEFPLPFHGLSLGYVCQVIASVLSFLLI